MSWIDKELKRRSKKPQSAAPQIGSNPSEFVRMQELWTKIKDCNGALPSEIQLRTETGSSVPDSGEGVNFLEWLCSPNGAALGFAHNAIRYVWPEKSLRRSNNFWIRWDVQKELYVLNNRISTSIPPLVAEYRFDIGRVEYMVKWLVLGRRINARALRKRRLWIF
jgi:hypothetical protein